MLEDSGGIRQAGFQPSTGPSTRPSPRSRRKLLWLILVLVLLLAGFGVFWRYHNRAETETELLEEPPITADDADQLDDEWLPDAVVHQKTATSSSNHILEMKFEL